MKNFEIIPNGTPVIFTKKKSFGVKYFLENVARVGNLNEGILGTVVELEYGAYRIKFKNGKIGCFLQDCFEIANKTEPRGFTHPITSVFSDSWKPKK